MVTHIEFVTLVLKRKTHQGVELFCLILTQGVQIERAARHCGPDRIHLWHFDFNTRCQMQSPDIGNFTVELAPAKWILPPICLAPLSPEDADRPAYTTYHSYIARI